MWAMSYRKATITFRGRIGIKLPPGELCREPKLLGVNTRVRTVVANIKTCRIRPQLLDLSVHFSADSNLLGPTKIIKLTTSSNPTQKMKWPLEIFFYFTVPPTLQKWLETNTRT